MRIEVEDRKFEGDAFKALEHLPPMLISDRGLKWKLSPGLDREILMTMPIIDGTSVRVAVEKDKTSEAWVVSDLNAPGYSTVIGDTFKGLDEAVRFAAGILVSRSDFENFLDTNGVNSRDDPGPRKPEEESKAAPFYVVDGVIRFAAKGMPDYNSPLEAGEQAMRAMVESKVPPRFKLNSFLSPVEIDGVARTLNAGVSRFADIKTSDRVLNAKIRDE